MRIFIDIHIYNIRSLRNQIVTQHGCCCYCWSTIAILSVNAVAFVWFLFSLKYAVFRLDKLLFYIHIHINTLTNIYIHFMSVWTFLHGKFFWPNFLMVPNIFWLFFEMQTKKNSSFFDHIAARHHHQIYCFIWNLNIGSRSDSEASTSDKRWEIRNVPYSVLNQKNLHG